MTMQHSSGFGRTVWFAALCLSRSAVDGAGFHGQHCGPGHRPIECRGSLGHRHTDQRRRASPEKHCNGSDGNYLFPSVAPGFYRFKPRRRAFKTYEVKGLEVQVAQPVKHAIPLEVGDTATRVEVVATAPVLDQRSAEIGQVVGRKKSSNFP